MSDTRPESPLPAHAPLPETVVIVGASGFIGHNLVRRLSRRVGRIVPVSASGQAVEGIAGLRLADLDGADIGSDAAVVNVAAHRYDGTNFAASQPEIFARNVEIATRVYEFCARRGMHHRGSRREQYCRLSGRRRPLRRCRADRPEPRAA